MDTMPIQYPRDLNYIDLQARLDPHRLLEIHCKTHKKHHPDIKSINKRMYTIFIITSQAHRTLQIL